MSKTAGAAGISTSTISGWTTRRSTPRLGHLAAVGLEVEWRIQWRPLDPKWPGLVAPGTIEPPEPQDWWGGGAWRRRLSTDSSTEVSPAYLAALLGAEVRWWRLVVARKSLEAVDGMNMKTWADFENGPESNWYRLEKPRLVKSAPLTTAVFIGRQAGFILEWTPRSALWRVPPWESAGPPARIRSNKGISIRHR